MTLGFLGAGAITSAIVTGLSSPGGPCPPILLSPRNAETAAALAARFPNVRVAPSNQDVLDASQAVFLAVRPQVAVQVLSQLRFSPHHTVITLIANTTVQQIAGLVHPAARISRAVPLPSTAHRACPIPLYPPDPEAAGILDSLGQVIPVDTEDLLSAFGAATSTMAAHFAFLREIAAWLTRQGLSESLARAYVAQVFSGLSATAAAQPHLSFEQLAEAHATPGGLNEQLLAHLTRQRLFEELSRALDAVRARSFSPPPTV